MGQRRINQETSQWYLIASRGDMTIRVRPGMPLGETADGNLSFDPACAQIVLDIADDGDLVVRAADQHQLETDDGERCHSTRFSRDLSAEIRLPHNVLRLDTDFIDRRDADASIAVRAADAAAADAAQPEAPLKQRFEVLESAPTTAQSLAPSPSKPSAEARKAPPRAKSGEPAPATEPAPKAAERAPITAPSLRSERQAAERGQARLRRLNAALIGLACIAVAAAFLLLQQEPPPGPMEEVRGPPQPQDDAAPPAPAPASESMGARLPDTVPEPVLLPVPDRSAALGQTLDPADEAGTEPAFEEPPAVAEVRVEPIEVPPITRRSVPEPGGDERSSERIAAPEPLPAAAREPALPPPDPAQVAVLEQVGAEATAQARTLTRRRDLLAAELALAQGRLASPPGNNALALYQRILEEDPGSPAAQSGLQSVRQALINRALAEVARNALADARETLDAAAEAGANPLFIEDLRGEVEYRQRLLDARAGRFDELYPIEQLVAVYRDPPRVPRLAPALDGTSVAVEFTVTTEGDVQDITVLDNPPETLEQAARTAVETWQFEPVLLDGQPIPVRSSVRFTFRN